MSTFSTLTPQQRERLSYLEMRLLFLGEVVRLDLTERFKVHGTAATRDFALYLELAPNNLRYDRSKKRYLAQFPFRPIFDVSPERALAWVKDGLGDTVSSDLNERVATDTPLPFSLPNLVTLSAVTRAIFAKEAIEIDYCSSTSGISTRTIVPHALVDDGLRWHARSFDRKSGSFRDFVINRMEAVRPAAVPSRSKNEEPGKDEQWQRVVEIELVPHPAQPHPKSTLLDFGIEKPPLRLKGRAATIGYTLRKWNVDCSPDHSLVGPEYKLWLQNSQTLYGVETAKLAPGSKF